MNQVTIDVLIMMGSYVIIFFLTIIVFNFLSNGFLIKYLVVKASRGRKVLISLWIKVGVVYITGKIDEGALLLKDNKTVIIIVVCVLILFGVMGSIFMQYQNQEILKNTFDVVSSINKTSII